jgi:predicted PurR-regulated permease PerM
MPRAVLTPDKSTTSTASEPITRSLIAAWILTGIALILIPVLHLVSALVAGLLVYELVSLLAPIIERHLMNRWSRWLAVGTLALLIIIALVGAGFAIAAFIQSEASSPDVFSNKLDEIITDARSKLPPFLIESFPGNVDDLRTLAFGWLDEHSHEVQQFGQNVVHFLFRGLVGMFIGALVSLFEVTGKKTDQPLAAALSERIARFGNAFRQIVFAQIRISALNTVLTAIFIFAILPALGIHLPLSKTLIAVTFFAGLLPVVGNLISNTAIFVAGLSVSIYAGVFALIFLVVIHKLEYFFNARIVGSSIYARAWELLVAMLVMEVAFGLSGLLIAPIYYAYVKRELVDRNLV